MATTIFRCRFALVAQFHLTRLLVFKTTHFTACNAIRHNFVVGISCIHLIVMKDPNTGKLSGIFVDILEEAAKKSVT